jgi:DNA-directed RNA polymerase sigma subunit (sigma70/sigma32)
VNKQHNSPKPKPTKAKKPPPTRKKTGDNLEQSPPTTDAELSKLAAKVFEENIALVKSIVNRFDGIDHINGKEDYIQQAYLGTHNAVRSYRVITDARFQTILVWHIQKALEKLIPPQNRQVIVTYPNGDEKLMSYQAFRKIKRGLPDGTTYRTESRSVSWEALKGINLEDDNGIARSGKKRRPE